MVLSKYLMRVCVCVYACACLQSLFASSRYSRADAFANAANAAVVSLS